MRLIKYENQGMYCDTVGKDQPLPRYNLPSSYCLWVGDQSLFPGGVGTEEKLMWTTSFIMN